MIKHYDELPKEPVESISRADGIFIGNTLLSILHDLNVDKQTALGLAAPQVDINFQVFALSRNPRNSGHIWINPSYRGVDPILTTEGCLSIPEQNITVMRYKTIWISGSTEKHEYIDNEILTGIDAIVFQHEWDHLQGKTLFDRKVRL